MTQMGQPITAYYFSVLKMEWRSGSTEIYSAGWNKDFDLPTIEPFVFGKEKSRDELDDLSECVTPDEMSDYPITKFTAMKSTERLLELVKKRSESIHYYALRIRLQELSSS